MRHLGADRGYVYEHPKLAPRGCCVMRACVQRCITKAPRLSPPSACRLTVAISDLSKKASKRGAIDCGQQTSDRSQTRSSSFPLCAKVAASRGSASLCPAAVAGSGGSANKATGEDWRAVEAVEAAREKAIITHHPSRIRDARFTILQPLAGSSSKCHSAFLARPVLVFLARGGGHVAR